MRGCIETPQSRWSREAGVKIEETAIAESKTGVETDRKAELLRQLQQARSSPDASAILTTGKALEDAYGHDPSVMKEVGIAYCANEETRRDGIQLLSQLAEKTAAVDIYSELAKAYGAAQQWEAAALNFFRAGEMAKSDGGKFLFWAQAAYMYWLNHNYQGAAEVGQKVVDIALHLGGGEERTAKNALAYYWAELGQNLQTGLEWCLDILEIPKDESFVSRIESGRFRTEPDRKSVV